jgi:hypothetical protein
MFYVPFPLTLTLKGAQNTILPPVLVHNKLSLGRVTHRRLKKVGQVVKKLGLIMGKHVGLDRKTHYFGLG